MLLIQQYQSLFTGQSQDLEKEARRVSRIFRLDFQIFVRFFLKRKVRKIDFFLLSQEINAKGLLADIQKNTAELNGKDLSEIIHAFEKTIKLNIKLNEIIQTRPADPKNKNPEIASWNQVLEDTIENLYAILRILKRYNLRTPIETSSLAVDSANSSLISLETVIHDRRST